MHFPRLRFRVGTKIIGGYVIVIAGVLLVGLVAIVNLGRVNAATKSLVGDSLPGVEVADNLALDLAEFRLTELRVTQVGASAQLEEQLNQLRTAIEDDLKTLEGLVSTSGSPRSRGRRLTRPIWRPWTVWLSFSSTEEMSASVEEMVASAQSLASLAQDLQNMVAKFKI